MICFTIVVNLNVIPQILSGWETERDKNRKTKYVSKMQICSLLNYTAENSMFMFCKESYKHILCARLTFGAKPQLAEKDLK